jgi:hypothetical protein
MRIERYEDTFNLKFLEAVASFPAVIEPRYNKLAKADEFSVDILIPKGTDMTDFEQVVAEVIEKKWPKGQPKFTHEYLKNGDMRIDKQTGEIMAGYKGNFYITARAKADRAPAVRDAMNAELTRPDAIVGGDICHFFVSCFAYEHGQSGISFGLEVVRLVRKADSPFGGGISKNAASAALDQHIDMDI